MRGIPDSWAFPSWYYLVMEATYTREEVELLAERLGVDKTDLLFELSVIDFMSARKALGKPIAYDKARAMVKSIIFS
jgi:hypothetical protein